ncbi:MAG: hypothetical protein ABJL28_13715 [Marinomonas sp.]
MKEVFRAAEVDAAAFDKSLLRLNGTLGDVQRGVKDEATKALEEMGLSTRITSGEIETADQLLDAIAGSAESFGTEAEFTSAMVDVFGQKLGGQLAPALRMGTEAINEAEQALIDAGYVIDEFSVNKLAQANESIDRFSSRSSVAFTQWAASAIDAIQSVSNAWDSYQANVNYVEGGGTGKDTAFSEVNQLFGYKTHSDFLKNGLSGGALKPTAAMTAPRRSGGGGGSSRRSTGGGSGGASKALSEEQRLTKELEKQTLEYERQWKLNELRAFGLDTQADILESNWRLEDKFGKLSKGRLEILKQQNTALIHQEAQIESIVEAQSKLDVDAINDQDQIAKQLDALAKANGYGADEIEAANVRIAKSFKDSAMESIAAIDSLANAAKGGSFLDILSSVIGLGLQLGSIGAFGSSVAKNINATKGYADGTGYAPGGVAIVGERGPELVNLPRGSEVVPNHQLGGGAGGVMHFDLRGAVMTQDLLNQMNQIGARSAIAGAQMGSAGTQQTLARQQTRRLA